MAACPHRFFAVCLLLLKTAGMLTPVNAFGLLDVTLLLVNTVLAWIKDVPDRNHPVFVL